MVPGVGPACDGPVPGCALIVDGPCFAPDTVDGCGCPGSASCLVLGVVVES